MELREALTQISEIRQQMARTEVFRGYRAMPVAFSGLLALAAAGFQAVWIAEPVGCILGLPALWIGRGGGQRVGGRDRDGDPRSRRVRRRRWTPRDHLAGGRAVPARAWSPGGLLTVVLVRLAPESLWMLPGLWQILFSLGDLRLVPAPAAGDVRGGGLLPRRGPDLPGPGAGRGGASRPGRWASPSASASSSRRPCSTGRWSAAMTNAKTKADDAVRAGSPTTAWSASSTRRPGSGS